MLVHDLYLCAILSIFYFFYWLLFALLVLSKEFHRNHILFYNLALSNRYFDSFLYESAVLPSLWFSKLPLHYFYINNWVKFHTTHPYFYVLEYILRLQ